MTEPVGSVVTDALAEAWAAWNARRERDAAARGMTVEQLDRWERERETAQQAEEERRELSKRLAAALRYSGLHVSPADRDALLDGTLRTDTLAMRTVAKWLDLPIPLVMLCGSVGTGKTVAAAWAVLETVRRRPRTRISGAQAAELGQRVNPYPKELERGVQVALLDAGFFVLDDLGTESVGDARFEHALFALVDGRLGPRTRTVITTNLASADIRPRYGDRIADRLNHIGRAVEIRGETMRRKGEL